MSIFVLFTAAIRGSGDYDYYQSKNSATIVMINQQLDNTLISVVNTLESNQQELSLTEKN